MSDWTAAEDDEDARPGPVFGPAIPPAQRRLMHADPYHLVSPARPRPGKSTRWRDEPVTTSALFGLMFLLAGLIGFVASATAVGLLDAAQGGVVRLGLLLIAIAVPMRYAVRAAREDRGPRLARIHHGRYLCPEDFDAESGRLLCRAERAVDQVLKSRVNANGLVDKAANDVILPGRLWEIAQTLRTQTALRAEQADAARKMMTPALRAVLAPQRQALALSVAAVTRRIETLEEYAELVQAAESAYIAQRLLDSNDKYRDLLAGTDDEESLQQLTARARQTEAALRDSLAVAIHTGQTLALTPVDHQPGRHQLSQTT